MLLMSSMSSDCGARTALQARERWLQALGVRRAALLVLRAARRRVPHRLLPAREAPLPTQRLPFAPRLSFFVSFFLPFGPLLLPERDETRRDASPSFGTQRSAITGPVIDAHVCVLCSAAGADGALLRLRERAAGLRDAAPRTQRQRLAARRALPARHPLRRPRPPVRQRPDAHRPVCAACSC